jgi:hypothetical protein
MGERRASRRKGLSAQSGSATGRAALRIEAHRAQEEEDGSRRSGRRHPEVLPAAVELGGLVPWCKQSVVADPLEAVGKDVLEESSQETRDVQCQDFALAPVRVVSPAETHLAAIDPQETVVGERDAIGVAGEVVHDGPGARERHLAVDDPVRLSKPWLQLCCRMRCPLPQCLQILATEDLGHGTHREEIAAPASTPHAPCGIQSSHADDAVHMDVKSKILTPGMEHDDDRRLRSQSIWVSSEGEQGLRRRLEKQVVHEGRTAHCQGVQRVGKSEDDVCVLDGQQLGAAGLDPPLLGDCLALRTVAIAAGSIDRAMVAAARAHLDTSAQGGSATAGNGSQYLALLDLQLV